MRFVTLHVTLLSIQEKFTVMEESSLFVNREYLVGAMIMGIIFPLFIGRKLGVVQDKPVL